MSEQLNSFNQILSIAHGNTLGNKNKDARDKREKIKVDIEPEAVSYTHLTLPTKA